MTYERNIAIGLIIQNTIIMSLSLWITYLLNYSILTLITLGFILILTLSFLSIKIYNFWRLKLMSLTVYTQLLAEGVSNIAPIKKDAHGLFGELQTEINQLALQQTTAQHKSLLSLSTLMDEWHIAIAIFDQNHTLVYRNPAMLTALKQPLLVGSDIQQCGFSWNEQQLTLAHHHFNQHWQTQNISFKDDNQTLWLFTATNISLSLQNHESITQQNLIRVFSHELRNSLTPMASMTDTLLSNSSFDEEQVRMVLTRINQRSSHLLDFIGRYADISRISPPKLTWFDITTLMDESRTVLEQTTQVNINGEKKCYGDRSQLSMVFTNLFTNSQQAIANSLLTLDVTIYLTENMQTIEIQDNGDGFINLENTLTPFYTTKSNGNGIGLSLCREIVHQHGGYFQVSNTDSGALATMSWPIN